MDGTVARPVPTRSAAVARTHAEYALRGYEQHHAGCRVTAYRDCDRCTALLLAAIRLEREVRDA